MFFSSRKSEPEEMISEDINPREGEEPAVPGIKYSMGENKLSEYNWLADLPYDPRHNEVVEVRFKNTRKGFYRNINDLGWRLATLLPLRHHPDTT